MKFRKYSLFVHSKASNIGGWGETGRHPLIYEACKLAIDFYTRVENSDNPLISAAFHEQVTPDLDWFSDISKLVEKYKGARYTYQLKCKALHTVNVNVNVISRTALIRNRVSCRVFHVSKITWGVLYLFQEAQTHWLPVLGVPPRVVPYTWPILKCCAV